MLLALSAFALFEGPASSSRGPKISAYRGLGTWVDIYEQSAWSDPEGTVASMKAQGVRTIFIESSNYSRPTAILYPDALGRFIDAAHAQKMFVVAWYLPSFAHLKKDFARSMAAIEFTSSTGQLVDSFGLDIEASVVTDPAARSRRLLALSARIRDAAGPDYPLGAITPNPARLDTDTGFWPDFPYRQLTQYFNVFVPMDYFSSVAHGAQAAHDYTAEGIDSIREHSADPTFPIHVIGGIANDLSGPEVDGFIHAARERGVLGASLYNYSATAPVDWAEVKSVPVNPPQSPALPVAIGDVDALGNIPRVDRTHPQEVFYSAPGAPGLWELSFRAFDVQQGEVRVWVNWHQVATLDPTQEREWSETRTIQIEDALWRDHKTNYIAFTAAGTVPDWSVWGVRDVNLAPPA